MTDRKRAFWRVNFAHRGLFDNDNQVPENSMAAFKAAVEEGYGIELDVQLSKDGEVVVFHDHTLDRMCKVAGNVEDYTYEELHEMRLLDTDETISLLSDVLSVIEQGTGPLIVELKTCRRRNELCRKTYDILQQYKVVYCVESFDPFIVYWFKKNAPEVVRGQLAQRKSDYPKEISRPVAAMLANCCFSFLNKPDFIAYKNVERPRHVHRLRKKGVMLFAWTSTTPDVDQKENDGVIFEQYRPAVRF
ncbi:MAG: glycerophosphodiester phosphodiesterase family protein [Lachnospiraceae bacterium]